MHQLYCLASRPYGVQPCMCEDLEAASKRKYRHQCREVACVRVLTKPINSTEESNDLLSRDSWANRTYVRRERRSMSEALDVGNREYSVQFYFILLFLRRQQPMTLVVNYAGKQGGLCACKKIV
eukprot:6483954-Amphidinium_carterae.1